MYRYHVISWTQRHGAFFCCSPWGLPRAAPTASFDSWATLLFIRLHGDRTGTTDWCKNKRLVQDRVYKLTESFVTKTYQFKSCNIKNPEAWFLFQLMCTVVVYNAWKFHDDRCIIFRVMAILLTQKVHFLSFFGVVLEKRVIFTAWSHFYLDQRHTIELLALNFILLQAAKNDIKIASTFWILWKKIQNGYVVTKFGNFYKNGKECIADYRSLIIHIFWLTSTLCYNCNT